MGQWRRRAVRHRTKPFANGRSFRPAARPFPLPARIDGQGHEARPSALVCRPSHPPGRWLRAGRAMLPCLCGRGSVLHPDGRLGTTVPAAARGSTLPGCRSISPPRRLHPRGSPPASDRSRLGQGRAKHPAPAIGARGTGHHPPVCPSPASVPRPTGRVAAGSGAASGCPGGFVCRAGGMAVPCLPQVERHSAPPVRLDSHRVQHARAHPLVAP